MMFEDVHECEGHWELSDPTGGVLRLPKLTRRTGDILIATAGTRRTRDVNIKRAVQGLADAIAELRRPITLIDVRRAGVGGSGSWGPDVFTGTLPEMLGAAGISRYTYYHLPILAPTRSLLDRSNRAAKSSERLSEAQIEAAAVAVDQGVQPDAAAFRHHEVFRAAYLRELQSTAAVAVARAFVEAANEIDGIPILLCAEARRAEFHLAAREEQDADYCHRFTLAAQVAAALKRGSSGMEVVRLDFSIGESVNRVRL
jgi:hypothetical protein